MPTNITEKEFESIIENYLLNTHNYTKRVSNNYDKDFCVDKELLVEYIKSTQPKKYEQLVNID